MMLNKPFNALDCKRAAYLVATGDKRLQFTCPKCRKVEIIPIGNARLNDVTLIISACRNCEWRKEESNGLATI